jgi:uncharacterized protein YbjT (DUF2867 family)
VILLTGATGNVGSALLRRLVATGKPVRVFVRHPRNLGLERVRVQIALGDLSDASSFRHALRGVSTVVHLAAAIRDQERDQATIEEVNGLGTLRLVRAAERAGVERFIFFSAIGASTFQRPRFFRAKALAEEAVEASGVTHTIFAPSIIYSPGDPFLTLLNRLALLSPVMPVAGNGAALYQPIWADDVADCVTAVLDGKGESGSARYELAGPDTLSYDAITRLILRSFGRRRVVVHVPMPLVSRFLRLAKLVAGNAVFATWDEVELMTVPMTSPTGTADAERLGVHPRAMRAVLGVG